MGPPVGQVHLLIGSITNDPSCPPRFSEGLLRGPGFGGLCIVVAWFVSCTDERNRVMLYIRQACEGAVTTALVVVPSMLAIKHTASVKRSLICGICTD